MCGYVKSAWHECNQRGANQSGAAAETGRTVKTRRRSLWLVAVDGVEDPPQKMPQGDIAGEHGQRCDKADEQVHNVPSAKRAPEPINLEQIRVTLAHTRMP